jgi:biotin transport system substrate-specific component
MNTRKTLLSALFSGLLIVGAFIRIPLPPVPITLQTLFILLAGMLLGRKLAVGATIVYLFLGAVGLPVFTGGGGLAAMLGPTGGFLFGFLLASFAAGTIADLGRKENGKIQLPYLITAAIVGSLAVYLIGIPWLKFNLGLSWTKAFAAGMLPFIPGDLIKSAVSVLLGIALGPRTASMLAGPSPETNCQ